ncbi:malectin domain-containing carbohydrate-binding protein [Thalassobellus suaedae]|uniref:Malectin domain-containing carbohydrate-binding protein n=1 Tax=Thalassobellus suaedae TaxID=3074124 RepID=A0ABY9XU42_9FLAO|nr:malectin domain-containing carbohydrate-binding protein [Flavobacteriaceae bacterium HL-DH14]
MFLKKKARWYISFLIRGTNRWLTSGVKNGIDVYSNCDEVELFNDVNHESLGRLKNSEIIGTHFQWNNVDIKYNVLYAIGYVNGKAVAKDYIILNNLPEAPHFNTLVSNTNEILKPQEGYNYIYRVNSGGADYKDTFGNTWLVDVHKTKDNTWGSKSWTDDFEDLPAFYASQRNTFDAIQGTKDWKLFQDFRYGADKLEYQFPVPDGNYLVELYFNEPWYGTGGGMNCKDWRVFDIAINNDVIEKNLDIWNAVGTNAALKKTYKVSAKNGSLNISFPRTESGQAIISGIAIATLDKNVKPADASPKNIINVSANVDYKLTSWLNISDKQYQDSKVNFTKLPPLVYGADYLRFPNSVKNEVSGSFILKEHSNIYIAIDAKLNEMPKWLNDFKITTDTIQNSKGTLFVVYQKDAKKEEKITFESLKSCPDCDMYTIAVVPKYNMEEQDDRAILKLEAENATTTGLGIKKAFFKKSDYIEFTQNTKNSLTFVVNPGVANIYLMRYRFMNMNDFPVKVRLKIEDANGILLRNDDIEFPIQNKKWKVLNTTSGGFINAGIYKITIESDQMKGLRIESFEFQ